MKMGWSLTSPRNVRLSSQPERSATVGGIIQRVLFVIRPSTIFSGEYQLPRRRQRHRRQPPPIRGAVVLPGQSKPVAGHSAPARAHIQPSQTVQHPVWRLTNALLAYVKKNYVQPLIHPPPFSTFYFLVVTACLYSRGLTVPKSAVLSHPGR